MLRFLLLLVVVLAVVALVTRATPLRRLLWTMLALAVVYTILKLTGVIDAMAPGRMG